jgi:glycerol kinase
MRKSHVGGGAAVNDAWMPFQADVPGVPAHRWDGLADVRRNGALEREFAPRLERTQRESLHRGWHQAVARAREWEDR